MVFVSWGTINAMDPVVINSAVSIPSRELLLSFDRSPGPGGQNVNRVNTRVELRFHVANSRALSAEQRRRLSESLTSRLTASGYLIIRSSRFRSQGRNIQDCIEKFSALLSKGLRPPPAPRRQTKPSRGSIARRMESKRLKSRQKTLRRPPPLD